MKATRDRKQRMRAKRSKDDLRFLVCPKCKTPDRIAQIDIIPGYARINGVKKDGTLEWAGETEVDWDGQRPASNPREFVCLACNEKFSAEAIGL